MPTGQIKDHCNRKAGTLQPAGGVPHERMTGNDDGYVRGDARPARSRALTFREGRGETNAESKPLGGQRDRGRVLNASHFPRLFASQDEGPGEPVIVVNEQFERRYFPGRSTIDQRVQPGGPSAPLHRIVGVVQDAVINGIGVAGVHSGARGAGVQGQCLGSDGFQRRGRRAVSVRGCRNGHSGMRATRITPSTIAAALEPHPSSR